MGLSIGIHAQTGVADREDHVIAGTDWGVIAGVVFVEGNVGGLNSELAARRHGVARVHSEVHDYLINLTSVGADGTQFRGRNHHEIDVLTDHAGEHLEVFSDDFIEIKNFWSKHLLAAEGKQLASKRSCTLRSPSDFLCRAAESGIRSQAVQQEF